MAFDCEGAEEPDIAVARLKDVLGILMYRRKSTPGFSEAGSKGHFFEHVVKDEFHPEEVRTRRKVLNRRFRSFGASKPLGAAGGGED